LCVGHSIAHVNLTRKDLRHNRRCLLYFIVLLCAHKSYLAYYFRGEIFKLCNSISV